jgi:hypothetical protein
MNFVLESIESLCLLPIKGCIGKLEKIFSDSGKKVRDVGESIPKTIKKAGQFARQEMGATGEKLGQKLADFRVKRSELANVWSGKGDYLLHQASRTIKGWINRQHGNGK